MTIPKKEPEKNLPVVRREILTKLRRLWLIITQFHFHAPV